jgi:1-acyl-sn-glycerol-3-phosphate acyltransferase
VSLSGKTHEEANTQRAGIVETAKGVIATATLACNTVAVVCCMCPLAVLKLALPVGRLRSLVDRALNALAASWIWINGAWIAAVGRTRWEVSGLAGLRSGRWYLLSCNHQSWVDIFVLQKVFHGRVPLLKFFLKRELIYVPVIGLAWWALDFPFVRRTGGLRGSKEDVEATRRSCERFKAIPTCVINFLEGTRYTREKAAAQRSPYRHLLKPKAAGMAIALATMGDKFDALLDVTIVYPAGVPSFWDLVSGRLAAVIVTVRELPMPSTLVTSDSPRDPAFRGAVQSWVHELWAEKDRRVDELLQGTRS